MAKRTKNQIRAAKAKGSCLEYDVQASLEQSKNLTVTRTSERGYQRQYDIHVEQKGFPGHIAIECKRLKGISWNQLVKFYEKLVTVAGLNAYSHYVVFKCNQQPALVFHKNLDGTYFIKTFYDEFGLQFIKHKSTRVKK